LRLKLLFPDVDIKDLPKDNYINIYKNKIVDYNGVYPISLLIQPTHSGRNNGNVYLNDTYTLEEIDKYDRITYGVEASHIISCDHLHDYVHDMCFVKLNFFQRVYTKWHLKGFFIQDVDFKKDLWKMLLGAIIGSIITLIVSSI